MDLDDLMPKPAPRMALGDDLATLSISDLEARITACEAEIARVKAELAKKRAHEAAAAALFKR